MSDITLKTNENRVDIPSLPDEVEDLNVLTPIQNRLDNVVI
jgi:hypothetical protein